jgi:hypothetical protein
MSRMAIDDPNRIRRANQRHLITTGGKVGGAAGFTLGAANNLGYMATVAASQTGGKLVVPIPFLKVYWAITAFYALGQIESAGNTVTWDLELRKLTAAAADLVDATVASATQVSVTADAILNDANSRKVLSAPAVVSPMDSYYFIATATTNGSTDIALQGIVVEVTEY